MDDDSGLTYSVLVTPENPALDTLRRSWSTAVYSEHDGIAPMGSLHEAGDALVGVAESTRDGFVLVGSGVMIGPGLLLTATHVLDHFPRDGTGPAFLTFLAGGARAWLPKDGSNLSGPDLYYEGLRRKSDLTLLSCTLNSAALEQHPLMLAPLRAGLPLVGERLWAFGFRHGELVSNAARVTPYVSSGRVTAAYPHGRGQHLPAPCIEIDMDTKGGMSGGPVVNGDGDVVAIVSTSYEGGPTYATLIWDALRLSVLTSVHPLSSHHPTSLFTASDMGMVRIKGNVKRRGNGNVVLQMSEAEIALFVQSVDPSTIDRPDPNGGTFLDDEQLEALEERSGAEFERAAASGAIAHLEGLDIEVVRRFLAVDEVPEILLSSIQGHSVQDFEGVEDPEVISAQEREHGGVLVSYAFDLLSVIWTVSVPSASYRANAAAFDQHFMNVADDGSTASMESIQRCYFECELTLDPDTASISSLVITRTGVKRRRRGRSSLGA